MPNWIEWIWEHIIINIFKVILIVPFIILSIYFGLENNSTATVVFAGFALFFILFFYGSNFEIVELLGAKFKLRETLNQTAEIIDVLAEQIFILANIQAGGFVDKKKELEKQKEKTFKAINDLEKINIRENRIFELRVKYFDNNFLKTSFQKLLIKWEIDKSKQDKLWCIENFNDREKEIKKLLREINNDNSQKFKTLLDSYLDKMDENSIQDIIEFAYKKEE